MNQQKVKFTEQKEIWKDVIGFEGFYQISNLGNIISKERTIFIKRLNKNTTRKIAASLIIGGNNGLGYLRLVLRKNNFKKAAYIHRIAAQAFIQNPDNKPCINHKNGIKSENRIENLEWCTYSENTIHSFNSLNRKGVSGTTGLLGKLNKLSLKVVQSKNGKIVKVWDSLMDAQRAGYTQPNITKCCKGKLNSHKGYQWNYL